jgi:cytochrome c biogenesis factor
MAFDRDAGHATFAVWIKPLVGWIWAGGLIVALGALIGALPLQKRKAFTATRPTEVVAA